MSSYQDKKDNLKTRLKRIEGQVRGLHKMVDEEKYCVDVLTQINAVKGALNKVGMEVLESHTKGCVTNAIKEEEREDEIINELMDVVFKFTNK